MNYGCTENVLFCAAGIPTSQVVAVLLEPVPALHPISSSLVQPVKFKIDTMRSIHS